MKKLTQKVRTASDAKESNPNNVFSSVTKTLARKVGHLANPTQSSAPADDDLETSMKAAQEDVQVLRSPFLSTVFSSCLTFLFTQLV